MGLHPDLLNPVNTNESQNSDDRYSEAGQSTENEAVPDQEILESIEQIYYEVDSEFDPCRYEFEKLPKVLNSKDIERYYKNLKQQQQVVSKKVLQLILQKQNNCKEEFERILLVQEQLQDTLVICRVGRTDLNLARKQFTTASLGILAHYRKRQIIEDLLGSLNTIKTLVSFTILYRLITAIICVKLLHRIFILLPATNRGSSSRTFERRELSRGNFPTLGMPECSSNFQALSLCRSSK